MSDFYVFDNSQVGALVFPINELGNNIKGAEVGCLSAQVSCCFLQKLYFHYNCQVPII